MRVGVPRLLTLLPPLWGSGKVWAEVLPRLAERCEVVVGDPGDGSLVDVWICDGAQGPLSVDQPVLAHIHEAPWGDPAVRATVKADIVERMDTLSKAAIQQAVRIVTGSHSGKAQLVERYGADPERVDVACNGVNHDVFRPEGPTAEMVIENAGGDPSLPYVLFVGTVLPRKNLPLMRAAMAELTDLPAALVLVAGPAIDRPSDELLAEAIAPIGGRPVVNAYGIDEADLAALMRGATILCCPSVTEGFGLPVVEAMSCGTPCVVSDRGALPEVLGDGGIAVPPELGPLVGALRDLLEHDERREQFARNAVTRGAVFNWDRTAETVWKSLVLVAESGKR